MHKDFFEYLPQFKPVINGNYKPRLRGVGVAMRRRLNIIPFAVTIPPAERDAQLVKKLKAEWPGVLQWMIDGCLDWQKRGLNPPATVVAATDAYFRDQDSLSIWLDECCERDPNASDQDNGAVRLVEGLGRKSGSALRRPDELRRWAEDLPSGFVWKHTKAGNGYQGLRIRQDYDLPFGGSGEGW